MDQTVTKLKLAGLGAAANTALEPHVAPLYAAPGKTMLAVVELEHVERTQPGPRSDKEASVTARVTHAEVPTMEQEPILREVLRYLFLQRTARGTLDEATGAVVLDEATLRQASGRLAHTDAFETRAALRHFADRARRAYHNDKATESTLRADLRGIADAIDGYLAASIIPDDEAPF